MTCDKQTMYLAMNIHDGDVNMDINNTKIPSKIKMPEGCEGVLFVFKTKQAAEKFWFKGVELIEIQVANKKD